MVLVDVHKENKKITTVPHEKAYAKWLLLLDEVNLEKIKEELNSKFDNSEIETSSWIPGTNWENTPYYPIYEAMGKNQEEAGYFFGLILWTVVQERSDVWGVYKSPDKLSAIKGTTYFKVEK